MSLQLTHQEQGWLDEFARSALPSLVGAYPKSLSDQAGASWVAHRSFEYALAMIEERREVLRKHAR